MTEREDVNEGGETLFSGDVSIADESKEAATEAAAVLDESETEAVFDPREAALAEAELGESDVALVEPSRAFVGGRVEPGLIGSRVLPDEWEEGEGAVVLDTVSGYSWSPPVSAELDGDEGETADALDEDESVSVEAASAEEEPLVEDVVYELAVAAASTGRDFDGPLLAEYLEQGGPVTDVRLSISIGVLRLGQKLTGDRFLGVLETLGFSGEAAAARVAREELGKITDVPVEVMTALPSSLEGS